MLCAVTFGVKTSLLVELRTNRGLSRQALSDASGVSMRTLARLEEGILTRPATLVRVLEALERAGTLDEDETHSVLTAWKLSPGVLERIRDELAGDRRSKMGPVKGTTHEHQTALRYFEKLLALTGAERTADMLGGLLHAEQTRASSIQAVKITGEPFTGPDGKRYITTVYHPTNAKTTATRAQKKHG